jgi:hypothetical protein
MHERAGFAASHVLAGWRSWRAATCRVVALVACVYMAAAGWHRFVLWMMLFSRCHSRRVFCRFAMRMLLAAA